jgi:hypothetical protein
MHGNNYRPDGYGNCFICANGNNKRRRSDMPGRKCNFIVQRRGQRDRLL